MKKFVFRLVLFGIVLAVFLELFFRFVLVATEWPKGVVGENGIYKYSTESFTDGITTNGRFCQRPARWSINNQGWNSLYEYLPPEQRDRPMIAVLGDSYVEGLGSDIETHIDVKLTEIFRDSVHFYMFATADSHISQYINAMRLEAEQFEPAGYIMVVNYADVAMSFREIGGSHPFYYQYELDDSGSYTEVLNSIPKRTIVQDILLQSALMRYVRGNLWWNLFNKDVVMDVPETDIECTEPSAEIHSAAQYLLGELNSFGRPVLIVADCRKEWIYDSTEEFVFADVKALREHVDEFENVSIVELADFYPEIYAEDCRSFSLENDCHWSGYGNQVVAEIISSYIELMIQEIAGESHGL